MQGVRSHAASSFGVLKHTVHPMPTISPSPIRRKARYFRHSFAQEGEDLILAEIFLGQRAGFFVDVGAHHPKRFSNTYHLYKFKGWRGINIDATPGSMKPFRRCRPDDINLECAVSDEPQILQFFVFNEPALNTFDPALAKDRDGFAHYRLEKTIDIQTRTLASLLDEHLPAGKTIDLLSVDVEGLDLQVLRSNDWSRYQPAVILAEDTAAGCWDAIASSPVTTFLKRHGYQPIARTLRTTFYRHHRQGDRP
jgi:FkbM family methyltransferase